MGFFSGELLHSPLYTATPDVQRLTRTVLLSTASHDYLFAPGAAFFESILPHYALFAALITEALHGMYIPTVYHPAAPPAAKAAALRVIGATAQKDLLAALYINGDCALQRSDVVAEMFRAVLRGLRAVLRGLRAVLRGLRADDEPAVRREAVAVAQRVCSVVSALCHQPAAVGDADVAALLDAKARFRGLLALFAEHPAQAVEQLQALGLCGRAPGDIVRFFRENVDLDKTGIGRFVCRHDDVSQAVLRELIASVDVAGMDVDEVLHAVFAQFVMSGEL